MFIKNWKLFIFIFIIAWIVQGIFTYLQVNNYRKRISELSKRGYVGIGKKSKKLGIGRILLLVSNHHKEIIHVEEMKGISVFTRFKEKEDLNKNLKGYSLEELEKKEFENEDLAEAIDKAIKDLRNKFEN